TSIDARVRAFDVASANLRQSQAVSRYSSTVAVGAYFWRAPSGKRTAEPPSSFPRATKNSNSIALLAEHGLQLFGEFAVSGEPEPRCALQRRRRIFILVGGRTRTRTLDPLIKSYRRAPLPESVKPGVFDR